MVLVPDSSSASAHDSSPSDSTPTAEPLAVAALETERHVASSGWDQNPRVFALVDTAALIAAEPQLAASLDSAADQAPGALSAIEQEDLPRTANLESLLGRMAWPESVDGVALAVERIVIPPGAERDLPQDPTAAVDALAEHPQREDVRLLVAVHRDGRAVCLLRQRANDRDDRVATGEDIAPGLVHALRATLQG